MPHKRSAEAKARANRIRSGKRWAEILYAKAGTIHKEVIVHTSINPLRCIIVFSHLGMKRFFPDYNNHYDEQPGVRRVWDHSQFEISIYTEYTNNHSYERYERYTYTTTFERLSKLGNFTANDLAFNNSYGSTENIIRMREAVHKWILTTMLQTMAARRSERIREDLVAAVWRPDRVAKRLEEGGWEAIDAFA